MTILPPEMWHGSPCRESYSTGPATHIVDLQKCLHGRDCRATFLIGDHVQEFPFSKDDWDRVAKAGAAICNATAMEDDVLHASRIAGLRTVLDDLQTKYGEHPVLLETLADFEPDPAEKIRLYRAAIDLAVANQLPAAEIRFSYARFLLEDDRDPQQAYAELLACREEIFRLGDDGDIQQWEHLYAAARERIGVVDPPPPAPRQFSLKFLLFLTFLIAAYLGLRGLRVTGMLLFLGPLLMAIIAAVGAGWTWPKQRVSRMITSAAFATGLATAIGVGEGYWRQSDLGRTTTVAEFVFCVSVLYSLVGASLGGIVCLVLWRGKNAD